MKHDIITPVQSEAAGLKHIKLEAHNKVLIQPYTSLKCRQNHMATEELRMHFASLKK